MASACLEKPIFSPCLPTIALIIALRRRLIYRLGKYARRDLPCESPGYFQKPFYKYPLGNHDIP